MKKSKPSNRTSPQQRLLRTTDRYAVDYMDHAPVWPALIFAKGLFRPTQNGAPLVPLEVHYEMKIQQKAVAYDFYGPAALNIVDQTLYFHLCQLLSAGKGAVLYPKHADFGKVQAAMAATGTGQMQPVGVVSAKLSDLACGVGLTRTGTNAQSMLVSLNRLSQASLHRQIGERGGIGNKGSSSLLAFECADSGVTIALPAEVTYFSSQHKGVAWVNMREHRALPSKPAKRLHAWLTAWASPVERKTVGLDKLLVNVWGELPASRDVRKDRLRTLRKAIKEVGRLEGWSCAFTPDGKQLLVRRPLFAGTAAQPESPAATPTIPAVTHTVAATTPTEVAVTPTIHFLKPLPSAGSDELVFSL
jgi:hypothetical protein